MEWFYEQNGQQVGPVSRTEIIRLIVQRRIQPHTLVWAADFGDQWRPAIKAGLIIPLSKRSRNNQTKIEGDHAVAVPSTWAWIFLLVPNSLALLASCIAYSKGYTNISAVPVVFILAIRIVSLVMDRRVLEASGIRPPSLFWFFFHPGYFMMRYERLGRGKALVVGAVIMICLQATMTLVSFPAFQKEYHARMEQMQQQVAPSHEKSPHTVAPQQKEGKTSDHTSEDQMTI